MLRSHPNYLSRAWTDLVTILSAWHFTSLNFSKSHTVLTTHQPAITHNAVLYQQEDSFSKFCPCFRLKQSNKIIKEWRILTEHIRVFVTQAHSCVQYRVSCWFKLHQARMSGWSYQKRNSFARLIALCLQLFSDAQYASLKLLLVSNGMV